MVPWSPSAWVLTSTLPSTPGPQFGQETSGGSGSHRQPIRSCPEVLEMRQLFQHRPLGAMVAHALDARLKVRHLRRSSWDGFRLGGLG